MFLKSFGILAPVAAAGLYVWSGLAGAYTREVERPPAAVIAALADLDVSLQAGSPGQDPSRPGAARPQIRRDYTKEGMVWTVMSGDKVATRLWATVEPLDGGRRSRVTTYVARGDAPDDRVAPAFRSEGVTRGLFATAIESRLDRLVAPPPAAATAPGKPAIAAGR